MLVFFSTMSFAQTEGSDDTTTVEDVTIEEVIVPTDVEVSVNNENTVTPKPAFTFVFKSATGDAVNVLDRDRNTLTKANLKENVTIKVNDVEIDFVVADLTNGADTNVDTVSFITVDNYYLPSKAKVNVTLPDLEFSGEAYNTMPQKIYSFYVEDYIIIDDVNKEYDFNPTKSVVIESGLTYEVAADKELVCKTLVLEGGATLKNNGTVTVKDTAFYHCIEKSYLEQANLINLGTYTAGSSVFVKYVNDFNPNDKNEERVLRNIYLYGNMMSNQMKLKDMTIYPFQYYSSYQMRPDRDTVVSNNPMSWKIGHVEKYIWNETQYDILSQLSGFKESGYFRFKGTVRNDEQFFLSNLVLPNMYWRSGNPYPSMVDLHKVASDPLNLSSTGAKQLLEFCSSLYADNIFRYNVNTGLTTYDGDMWKGYLMPAGGMFFMHTLKGYTVNITKEHLTDISSADSTYSIQSNSDYPYIRFYCDYVSPTKALGKGFRSVFVVYFAEDDLYSEIRARQEAQYMYYYDNIHETLDKYFVYENSYTYPCIGLYRPLKTRDDSNNNMMIKIGALPYPDEDMSDSTVSVGLYRHVKAFSSDDESFKVKIGVLDYDLKGQDIRFKCDELGLSFDNPVVYWNGKGAVTEGDGDELVDIMYQKTKAERNVFDFVFYKDNKEIPPLPEDDDIDGTGIETESIGDAYQLSIEGDVVRVVGMEDGCVCSLTSLSGVVLDNKVENNGAVSFEISKKGIYFVAVDNGTTKKVFKILK